jgi:hypothetical protein
MFLVVLLVKIAVTVAIPAMIVLHSPSPTFPIPTKKSLSIVVRCYPVCSRIRRASPIPFMPPVVALNWIPIPVHPDIIRTRGYWPNSNHPRSRWRANPDSQG